MLLLDIGNFKDINDTFGHLTGDETIRTVAAVLESRVRQRDVLGRVGGDEFGIVWPAHTGPAEAQRLAQDVREAIAAAPVDVDEGKHRLPLTVSIGVAAGGTSVTAEELLAQADMAMYEAKETGRNSARVFTPGTGEKVRARLTWGERILQALETTDSYAVS